MKVRKIIVVLALLVSTQAMAENFYLGCELTATLSEFKQEITFHVNPTEKTVNGKPAIFSTSSISFEDKLSFGVVTTIIDRFTGSVTLWAGKEAMSTGKCVLVEKRKF